MLFIRCTLPATKLASWPSSSSTPPCPALSPEGGWCRVRLQWSTRPRRCGARSRRQGDLNRRQTLYCTVRNVQSRTVGTHSPNHLPTSPFTHLPAKRSVHPDPTLHARSSESASSPSQTQLQPAQLLVTSRPHQMAYSNVRGGFILCVCEIPVYEDLSNGDRFGRCVVFVNGVGGVREEMRHFSCEYYVRMGGW